MVLESTVICVDNSEYMRNGDYPPTRFQSLLDAFNIVCQSKIHGHPENNVGLVNFTNGRVLVNLTQDQGRLLANLHGLQIGGMIKFATGINVAHLALKHRQGRNHRMRIVAFVGSPISEEEKELVKLAKRLKKEKVNVDVISMGQEEDNNLEKLQAFVTALNGKDGTNSHLLTVPPGAVCLSDALMSSPVVRPDDAAGGSSAEGAVGSFGGGLEIDAADDPELALALRVSMEEERARQAGQGASQSETPAAITEAQNSEDVLAQAIAASMGSPDAQDATPVAPPNFESMTEEEQIAYALAMSMNEGAAKEEEMEVDSEEKKTEESEEKKEDEEKK